MNMISEDYVSFETAKLLKEKGFDCNTNCYYIEDSVTRTLCYSPIRENHNASIENNELDVHINISSRKMSAPTLQMVMKWLRKWHNLHCDVGYDFRLGWHIQITSLKEIVQDHDTEIKTYLPHKAVNYPSYEDACEAAIKYCLENLI